MVLDGLLGNIMSLKKPYKVDTKTSFGFWLIILSGLWSLDSDKNRNDDKSHGNDFAIRDTFS